MKNPFIVLLGGILFLSACGGTSPLTQPTPDSSISNLTYPFPAPKRNRHTDFPPLRLTDRVRHALPTIMGRRQGYTSRRMCVHFDSFQLLAVGF